MVIDVASEARDALGTSARERFGELSEAETGLLDAVAIGGRAEAGGPGTNPWARSDQWGQQHSIRTEILRWLCTDQEIMKHIDARGILVHNAWIRGDVELDGADITFPLALQHSLIEGDVNLNDASLKSFSLSASHCTGLRMARTQVHGNVNLDAGFRSQAFVSLYGTSVEGSLYCSNGNFSGGTDALDATRIKVDGSVFLNQEFEAWGLVKLRGAVIHGNLNCDGATFVNPSGFALDAEAVTVDGMLLCRNGFLARGGINLFQAKVGHNLVLTRNSTVLNPEGMALYCERATIGGSLLCKDDFTADGMVNLFGASVGADFGCEGAAFLNPRGVALLCLRATFGGSIFCNRGFRADGTVIFDDTRIGRDFLCDEATFVGSDGVALSAMRMTVAGSLLCRKTFRAEGQVLLNDSSIGRHFGCEEGLFWNPGGVALQCGRATFGGGVFLSREADGPGFRAYGAVIFDGARIGRDLKCDQGAFRGSLLPQRGDVALSLNGATVGGAVRCIDGFSATGAVTALDASVGEHLLCTGGLFWHPGDIALLCERAAIGGTVSCSDGFQSDGRVVFDEARIGRHFNCDRGTFRADRVALSAIRATVQGAMTCTYTWVEGAVKLSEISIAQHLLCAGALFWNPGQIALAAQRATFGGDLMLGEGFLAEGQVNLWGSRVGGTFACDDGALFSNPGKVAVTLEDVTVGRHVLWRHGFRSDGQVVLFKTNIAGDFDCTAGVFHNPNGLAIQGVRTSIENNVFWCDGFHAEGSIVLSRSRIGGDLYCQDAAIQRTKEGTYEQRGRARRDSIAVQRIAQGKIAIQADAVDIIGSAIFDGLISDGYVGLRDARIGGDLSFVRARSLHGTVGGLLAPNIGVQRALIWHFDKQNHDEALSLDLFNARISRIVDWGQSRPAPGRTNIDGLVYESITCIDGPKTPRKEIDDRLSWIRLHTALSFTKQPYEQYAQVLRRDGRDTDAKRVAIARQDDLRMSSPKWISASRLGNWLLKCTIGHGYKPEWALGWGIAIVLLGLALFNWGFDEGLLSPAKKVEEIPTKFNAMTYSLDSFLPIINFHQEDYWLPNGNRASGRLLLFYYWCHVGLGWILTTLGVLGITGVVRRS